jgi:hypothetical protein
MGGPRRKVSTSSQVSGLRGGQRGFSCNDIAAEMYVLRVRRGKRRDKPKGAKPS